MSEYCKESVRVDAWHRGQCSRKAVRDGFCKQHHPDTEKAKRAAWDAKYEADRAKRKLADDITAAASAIVEAADKWRNDPRAGIMQLAAAVDAWRKLKGM